MNHGDAFSGIGGFGLAAQRAGFTTVWACEIEPSARAVYSARLGHDGLRFDTDIRESRNLPHIDILTGGFPCQDLSVAGKRAGLAGSRSGLFFELVRILEESRPAWFVFENVDALLSSNSGRDMGVVLSTLVECGYSVAWRVLNSRYFGLAQRRSRVFLVGHSSDGSAPTKILFERPCCCRNSAPSRPAGRDDRAGDQVGTLQAGGKRGYRIGAEDARDGHLVSALLSRGAKGIGTTRRSRPAHGNSAATVRHPVLVAGTVVGSGGTRSRAEDARTSLVIAQNQRGEVRTSSIAMALSSGGGGIPGQGYHLTQIDASGVGETTGLPGPLDLCPICEDGPDAPRYRGIGNAVSVPVVEWLLRRVREVST